MENRNRMRQMATDMMGLETISDLPKGLNYWLCEAYSLCESKGGLLLSRQVIAGLVTQWKMLENFKHINKLR